MLMQELGNNIYTKGTDSVERYLINLVNQYFKSNNTANETSKEYIINEAVKRLKEDVSFDNAGVLTITLPSGEVRKGAVNLTLSDLNGEPKIEPKYSAFNVPFGNKANTACEGNDPRLSDKRNPLAHQHDIKDINGLDGKLNTLQGKIDRLNMNTHEHENKDILDILTYSGDKDVIDLTKLDTFENYILDLINEIKSNIFDYKDTIDNKVKDINSNTTEIIGSINNLDTVIKAKNDEYLQQANDYTDKEVAKATNDFETKIENYIKSSQMSGILNSIRNTYSLVGETKYELFNILNKTINIEQNITDIISKRQTSIKDCIIDAFIQYKLNAKNYTVPLPFIVAVDNDIKDKVQLSLNNNTIFVSCDNDTNNLPDYLFNSKIIIKYYSKDLSI